MKFLIDMPLSSELVSFLSKQGHEAIHAIELGLQTASDEVLLARAHLEERVLITIVVDRYRIRKRALPIVNLEREKVPLRDKKDRIP